MKDLNFCTVPKILSIFHPLLNLLLYFCTVKSSNSTDEIEKKPKQMTKYLLSFLIICPAFIPGYSQNSLILKDVDSVVIGNETTPMESYATLINTQSYQITVGAKRKVISSIAGSTNFFCWDVCYLEQIDSSSGELTIGGNDTLYNFYGHYAGQGNPGLCIIEYCFFDIDYPADSVCYRANYYGGVTGIESLETSKEGAFLYPNPSQGQVTLTYKTQMEGNYFFVMADAMGQIVRSPSLERGFSGELTLDLSTLANGFYTYQLWKNNTALTIGKFALKN